MRMKRICTLITLAFLGMSATYTSASVLLDFAIGQQTLSNSFANIHFATPGNDLGGGFFFVPSDSLTLPITISLG